MDGVSIAASIVGIATAGVAISIKLVTLATQISTASERVSSIGNDISLTSGVLHQLGELMTQKTTNDGISIFSQGGLETTKTSAAMCERIFREVEKEVKKASEQIRGCKRLDGGKVKLSKAEKAKWPFLQPSIDSLRVDLREAKGTLMLMLQVTSLALSKRMADLNQSASASVIEQRDFMRAIVALQQQRDKPWDDTQSFSRLRKGYDSKETLAPSIDLSSSGDETSTTFNDFRASTLPTRPKAQMKVANAIEGSLAQLKQPSRNSMSSNIITPNDIDTGSTSYPALAAIHLPKLESVTSNSSTLWSDRSDDIDLFSPDTDSQCKARSLPEEVMTELQLFLLKPMVKDYFDKIELSWSVQNTKSQDSAIRKHIEKNDKDGVPSVIDMLESLQAYEQQVIDGELSRTDSVPEGSLLSLKRTKTDIRHRDITLKDVPGLQFVVERRASRPPPAYPGSTKDLQLLARQWRRRGPGSPHRITGIVLDDCCIVTDLISQSNKIYIDRADVGQTREERAAWILETTDDGELFYLNSLTGKSTLGDRFQTPSETGKTRSKECLDVDRPDQAVVPPVLDYSPSNLSRGLIAHSDGQGEDAPFPLIRGQQPQQQRNVRQQQLQLQQQRQTRRQQLQQRGDSTPYQTATLHSQRRIEYLMSTNTDFSGKPESLDNFDSEQFLQDKRGRNFEFDPTAFQDYSSLASDSAPKQGDKPLSDITDEDPSDNVAVKRAQNTLAARKSREKRVAQKEAPIVENSTLKDDVACWKDRAASLSTNEHGPKSNPFEGLVLNEEGAAVGKDGESIAELVQGDPKLLAGKMLDHEGNVRDYFGNIVGTCELIEYDEPEGMPYAPFAGLEGLVVTQDDFVEDARCNKVGKVVEGDSKELVRNIVGEDGSIRDQRGVVVALAEPMKDEKIVNSCDSLSGNEREAKPEGPFAGLKDLVVAPDGFVEDEGFNKVGKVVEGDWKRLLGRMVDEDGDVIDKYGNVTGHAETLEDAEIEGVTADEEVKNNEEKERRVEAEASNGETNPSSEDELRSAEPSATHHRSQSQRRQRASRSAEEDTLVRHQRPRSREAARRGLSGAAVVGLVERARSKSPGRRGRSRSKSRTHTGHPIAAAGLGSAAIAELYKKKKDRMSRNESLYDGGHVRGTTRSKSPPIALPLSPPRRRRRPAKMAQEHRDLKSTLQGGANQPSQRNKAPTSKLGNEERQSISLLSRVQELRKSYQDEILPEYETAMQLKPRDEEARKRRFDTINQLCVQKIFSKISDIGGQEDDNFKASVERLTEEVSAMLAMLQETYGISETPAPTRRHSSELYFHDDDINMELDLDLGFDDDVAIEIGRKASPAAKVPVPDPDSSTVTSTTTPIMTPKTEQSPIQAPIDTKATSELDEKRKRNATASHRFRAQRDRRNRETNEKIAKLEHRIREMEEDKERQRALAEQQVEGVAKGRESPKSIPMALAQTSVPEPGSITVADNVETLPMKGSKKRKVESEDDPKMKSIEKRPKITPEDFITTENVDEDALVVELLGRYTTLFQ